MVKKKKMKKRIFLGINYIISFGILIVLFKKLDLSIAIGKIMMSDPGLIIIAVMISVFFRLFLFSYFWQNTLNSTGKHLNFWDIFKINAVSLPLKYVVPFKINDVVRAAGLKAFTNTDFSFGLSSSVFIRILIICGTGIWFATGILLTGILTYYWLVLIIIGIVFVLLSFFPKIELNNKEKTWLFAVLDGFIQITKKSRIKDLFNWWFFQSGEIITSILLFKAIGLDIGLQQFLYYIPLMMLLSMLPISIQGIGLREGFLVLNMTGFGSQESLLSAGLLITIVHHLIPAFIGSIIWLVSINQRIFVLNVVKE